MHPSRSCSRGLRRPGPRARLVVPPARPGGCHPDDPAVATPGGWPGHRQATARENGPSRRPDAHAPITDEITAAPQLS
ncbi:hypothetical protein PT2222_380028 [Paraburkholderia tropica]